MLFVVRITHACVMELIQGLSVAVKRTSQVARAEAASGPSLPEKVS